MKKYLIALAYMGTLCAFNPQSPEHLHVRRLLGERKITQQEFHDRIRQLNNAASDQKATDGISQKRILPEFEKS